MNLNNVKIRKKDIRVKREGRKLISSTILFNNEDSLKNYKFVFHLICSASNKIGHYMTTKKIIPGVSTIVVVNRLLQYNIVKFSEKGV